MTYISHASFHGQRLVDVSVVLAVRDGARTLAGAISGILAQTWRPREIVVVDDGSADATVPVAKSFLPDVRIIETSARGRAEARNTAIERSSGEFILICDADDVSLPRRVECQLSAFQSDDRMLAVGGQVIPTQRGTWYDNVPLPTTRAEIDKWLASGRMPFAHPTMMFRREFFRRFGLYDPECIRAQDLELCSRARGHVEWRNLRTPLVVYSIADQHSSFDSTLERRLAHEYAIYSAEAKRARVTPPVGFAEWRSAWLRSPAGVVSVSRLLASSARRAAAKRR